MVTGFPVRDISQNSELEYSLDFYHRIRPIKKIIIIGNIGHLNGFSNHLIHIDYFNPYANLIK